MMHSRIQDMRSIQTLEIYSQLALNEAQKEHDNTTEHFPTSFLAAAHLTILNKFSSNQHKKGNN